MIRLSRSSLSALLCAGLLAGPALAMGPQDYQAAQRQLRAEWRATEPLCDALNDVDEDLCETALEGAARIQQADLKLQYQPSERHREQLRRAVARYTYEVSKEKCDRLDGAAERACEQAARRDFAAARVAERP